ncbi:hypothetical protein ACP8Y2_15945 [Herpetosiphon llansteffanensis]
MMIARQMVKVVAAGLLVVGLSTPAFASGTLTNKFTDYNTVNVRDTVNLMDYGMATAIGDFDDIAGVQTFVSAVRKDDDNLRVSAYYVNTTTNTKLGADIEDGGAMNDVAIDRVGSSGLVVAAVEMSDNSLKFIAYDVTTGTNGRTIDRLNDFIPSIADFSFVSDVQIARVGPLNRGQFVTIVRRQNGTMRLDSWKVVRNNNNTVTFTWLDFVDGGLQIGNEIAMIRNTTNLWQFATVHKTSNDLMNIRVWNVDQDASGSINFLSNVVYGTAIKGFDVAFSSQRLLTARYKSDGTTVIEMWDVDPFTNQVSLNASGSLSAGSSNGLQIFDMGGGDLVLLRENALGSLYQNTLSISGSVITADPGGDQHMFTDGFSGVDGGDGRLFYAVADANENKLTHQLWLHQ